MPKKTHPKNEPQGIPYDPLQRVPNTRVPEQSPNAVSMTETPIQRAAAILNGTYTVQSPSGAHRTFRIHTQPDAEKQRERRPDREPFAPGKRIISLLTGPNNEADYEGFGFVDDNGIRLWRRFADKDTFQKYAALVWSMGTRGEESKFHKAGARLLFEGRCLKCNRKLTTPESIRSGIGPICAGGGRDGDNDIMT